MLTIFGKPKLIKSYLLSQIIYLMSTISGPSKDTPVCRINKAMSEWSPITCGVKQGTKVGPVVFLAMVNDAATESPHRWKYVDDITVGEASTDPSSNMQSIMDSICVQASRDHMTLNVNKCALMQISFRRDPVPPPLITANGQTVPITPVMTLLGVTLTGTLKWDTHVL